MIDFKAKKAAQAATAAALHATHSHLVPLVGDADALTTAAKNIRVELKRAFPSVKFSVKSRRFSMGDAIDVRWTDGPNSDQVDAIIDRYSAGSFDGMTDCYEYADGSWTRAFGDARFVHSHRDYSDKAIASAIRTVFAKYEHKLRGIEAPTAQNYKRGALWSIAVPGLSMDLQSLVSEVIYRRTWALAAVQV